jgi:aspartate oxidase
LAASAAEALANSAALISLSEGSLRSEGAGFSPVQQQELKPRESKARAIAEEMTDNFIEVE